MKVLCLEIGPFDTNTYIIKSEESDKAIVIDPAISCSELLEAVQGLTVTYIVNTHGHFDHLGGNTNLKLATNAYIAIHQNDAEMLSDSDQNLSLIFTNPVNSMPADIVIYDDSFVFELDKDVFKVIEVPGHTEGSIALYNSDKGWLFSGDLIFNGAVGRTDLPGGDEAKLLRSVKKILELPDATAVYPGHENTFTIGEFRDFYNHNMKPGL